MKPEDIKEHLEGAKKHLVVELSKLRTGRASSSMVEDIHVQAYEGMDPQPIKELATIAIEGGTSITITPWDTSILKRIETGIRDSDLGIAPINQGNLIRLSMPAMTEETRKDVVKKGKLLVEESKITGRNIRQNAQNALKEQFEEGIWTEDEYHQTKDKLDDTIRDFNAEVDKIMKEKEAEIMSL